MVDPVRMTMTPAMGERPVAERPAPRESFTVEEPLVMGLSAGGRPLPVHRLGKGPVHVVIVGGIHGGYEWNAILLAEQMLIYFRDHPTAVPASVTLHIITNANPDGLYVVSGREGAFKPSDIVVESSVGRFNGNGVDLNRNWDCRWSPTAYWRDQPVPSGVEPFSEPESRALRDYLLAHRPTVVIFLHSAANAIYVGGCPDPDPRSEELAWIYGRAARYPVYPAFDYYPVTGDAGDWLTTQGIASFTVELMTHEDVEWGRNRAGILAVLNFVVKRQLHTIPGAYWYE